MCHSVVMSVCLSVCPLTTTFFLSVSQSVRQSASLSVSLPWCLAVCPQTTTFFLSASQSVFQSVYHDIWPSVPWRPPSSSQPVSQSASLSVSLPRCLAVCPLTTTFFLSVSQSDSQSVSLPRCLAVCPLTTTFFLSVSQSASLSVSLPWCLAICPLTATSSVPQLAVDTAGHAVDRSEISLFNF